MKNYFIITLIVILNGALSGVEGFAQKPDMTVPDSIVNELTTKELSFGGPLKMKYKVVYPENYDSTKAYPMVLGLSGGDQSEEVVNYCYYAWFRSSYFNNYITVLPLAPNNQNLKDLNPTLIDKFFVEIQKLEKLTTTNWVMLGTSMGGEAAFNFLKRNPASFYKAAVMPGELTKVVSKTEGWGHIDFVLANGSEDARWQQYTDAAYLRLKDVVKSIDKITMDRQLHIVSPDYDMDIIYKALFDTEK